jgi:hypothetical protein
MNFSVGAGTYGFPILQSGIVLANPSVVHSLVSMRAGGDLEEGGRFRMDEVA